MSGSNPPTSLAPSSLEQSLKHFFGYDSFRPGQREIVEAALQQRDMMIVMPTGDRAKQQFSKVKLNCCTLRPNGCWVKDFYRF